MDIKDALKKYKAHNRVATQRGIDFQFTFEEWCEVWIASGKWEERGITRGKYVMSRKGDIGPYSKDNVIIKTTGDNLREAHCGKSNTIESRQKMSAKLKGKPAWNKGITHTEETRKKISDANLAYRERIKETK